MEKIAEIKQQIEFLNYNEYNDIQILRSLIKELILYISEKYQSDSPNEFQNIFSSAINNLKRDLDLTEYAYEETNRNKIDSFINSKKKILKDISFYIENGISNGQIVRKL